ncbi:MULTISPECIES: hypothetical protein [Streptomyces]|nr:MULTISPECIES: hypothetical protein [Streptomyces]
MAQQPSTEEANVQPPNQPSGPEQTPYGTAADPAPVAARRGV